MISIIICSRNNRISQELEENIQNTIGNNYELITIDNSKNEYSIFSAYNFGTKLAKYPFLCFMHEDILFHTQDWGRKVINHFLDSKVGIIGVAGSYYLPKMPGSWWSSNFSTINVIHTINGETKTDRWDYKVENVLSNNVVILDGLWFCIPKVVMNQLSFDEKTFSGFHCYDSDICMQIMTLNYKVKVIYNIQIEHFSAGIKDKLWLKSIFKFYLKWKNHLPISSIELSNKMVSEGNYYNAWSILEDIKINKLGLIYILKIWFYYISSNPLVNKRNWILLLVLIKKIYMPEPFKSVKIACLKFNR